MWQQSPWLPVLTAFSCSQDVHLVCPGAGEGGATAGDQGCTGMLCDGVAKSAETPHPWRADATGSMLGPAGVWAVTKFHRENKSP